MNCGRLSEGSDEDDQRDFKEDRMRGAGFMKSNSCGVKPCLEFGMFLAKYSTRSSARGQSGLFSIHLESIAFKVE